MGQVMQNIEKKDENKTLPIPVVINGKILSDDEEAGEAKTELDDAPQEKDLDQEMRTRATEYLDQLQRLQAEFMNYRKRVDKEKDSLYILAKGEIIRPMLPILDDMERMISVTKEEAPQIVEGMKLIHQKFKKMLIDQGLEEMVSMGEKFDPMWHEAIGTEKTDPEKAGLVVEEYQKGYRMGDQLLRPSRVKVGQVNERSGDV